jgi:hypothetical protein
MYKLNKDISIVDLALYVDKTLIISDIHIGYEEALNLKGVLIPRLQFKDIIEKLDKIFSVIGEVDKVVINGDLKHEFGKISETEWRHTLRLLDYLSKKCKEIVLLKGNHDTILGPIAKKRDVKVKEYEKIKDILVVHGDKLAEKLKGVKTIIIGHEHPAVSLKDGPRVEKYKCFLKGKWKKYNLIVMPSFTPVVEGTDILEEELLSPFLADLDKFNVVIVADKVYDFGKLKNIKI